MFNKLNHLHTFLSNSRLMCTFYITKKKASVMNAFLILPVQLHKSTWAYPKPDMYSLYFYAYMFLSYLSL
ncbi:hypothetical protein BCE33L2220 [Bacillus cereus E33L]|uniref:Uncharacterized protein n=2 Tax=Bacillus cereus TaxID=1396 RepID=Q63BA6_BACCZ|nr:hypothetical protein BCE33L2220 [Bacillus cereus E33L]APT25939.1 hypothetical protein BVB96_12710 [Bacillus anthracis]